MESNYKNESNLVVLDLTSSSEWIGRYLGVRTIALVRSELSNYSIYDEDMSARLKTIHVLYRINAFGYKVLLVEDK